MPFNDIDYKHTAKVKRDSWFIRFYSWMWWADPDLADFCKLFWGYVFAIPNLLGRIVLLPFYLLFIGARALLELIGDWIDDIEQPSLDEVEKEREERRERRKRREEKVNRFFGFFSRQADRVAGFVQAFWPYLKWPAYVVIGAMGLAFVGVVGYGAYLLVALIIANVLTVATVLGVIVGIVLLIALVIIGVATTEWFLEDTEKGKQFRLGVKNGTQTFSGTIRTGFVGIKSRTCPKIELVD